MRSVRLIGWILAGGLLAWVMGCSTSLGGGTATKIMPAGATLSPGGSLQFSAAFPADWSVQEMGGGSVTQQGLYTAPSTAGVYHVVATDTQDPTQVGVASVVVGASGSAGAPLAAPLADAVTSGEPYGANYVGWQSMGGHVVAYIIYRDTNPMAPLAVIDGYTTSYLDSARPLPHAGDVAQTDTVTITLDPPTGYLLSFTHSVTYEQSLDNIATPNETMSKASYSVTAHRVPLQSGDTCGYAVKMLYYDYDTGDITQTSLQHPQQYALFLGNRSSISGRVTMIPPPVLDAPANGQYAPDGTYRCLRGNTTMAPSYTLQFSTNASYTSGRTITAPVTLDITRAIGTESLSSLWNTFGAGNTVFWRMGAHLDGQPLPHALSDGNQNGWVFSPTYYFQLPQQPPAPGSLKTNTKRVGVKR